LPGLPGVKAPTAKAMTFSPIQIADPLNLNR
jgi:hypothetical protein